MYERGKKWKGKQQVCVVFCRQLGQVMPPMSPFKSYQKDQLSSERDEI